MDRLQFIFEAQKELQKCLMKADLPAERPDLVAMYTLGLVSELGEVLQADKRWKLAIGGTGGNQKYHNRDEVLEELTDCLLYFVNLCLACGIDYDELFNSFVRVLNKVRKRNGLTEVPTNGKW